MRPKFSREEIQDAINDAMLERLDEAGIPADRAHVLRLVRAASRIVSRIALDQGLTPGDIRKHLLRALASESRKHDREKFMVGKLLDRLPRALA